MAVFEMNSDKYFLRKWRENSIAVSQVDTRGDDIIRVSYDACIALSSPINGWKPEVSYKGLKVFGVVIQGQKLQQLISDITKCPFYVNREGYCFLGYTDDQHKYSLNQVLGQGSPWIKLNDLFIWSKYGVTPTITTVWNRRDVYNKARLVDYEELQNKLSRYGRYWTESDEKLTECKSKVTKLEREASKHKKDLEEKDNIIKDKNKEIKQLKAELEGKKEELSTSKDSLKEKEKLLGEKDKELKNCKSELKEKKKELSKNKEKEKLLEEKEKDLKDCKTELEAKKKELEDSKAELEDKKKELAKLGDQVLTKNKRIGTLKVNINSLIVSIAALNAILQSKLFNQSPVDQADDKPSPSDDKDTSPETEQP